MSIQRRKMITVFCMSFMFLFAMAISIVGVLMPSVVSEYAVDLSTASVVTVAQNCGGILALIFCGYLSDRYGKFRVIVTLFGLMGASLLLALTISGFYGFAALAFALGLASSALNMAISAYLADLFGERRDYYVNLAGVFFGLGSVSGTLYLLGMQTLGVPWRQEFGILGFACAGVMAALTILSALQRQGHDGGKTMIPQEKSSVNWRALKDGRLALYAAIGFFYMAHSSAFMAWAPTFFNLSDGFSTDAVSAVMTVYWVAILGGRILYTTLSMRISPLKYLAYGNLVGGAAVLILLGADTILTVSLLVAVIGVATGAGFQVCLALTCRDFATQSGTASSIVALCASCGGTLCCWVTGMLANQLGFSYGLILLGVCPMLIAPLTTILKRRYPTENT